MSVNELPQRYHIHEYSDHSSSTSTTGASRACHHVLVLPVSWSRRYCSAAWRIVWPVMISGSDFRTCASHRKGFVGIFIHLGYLLREREMFYLTTHSTHFIYGYMASDTWLRTIQIAREEIRCRHIGYSYRLTARVLLYAPSHRQDNTYHGLCYTSRGALAGTRNSSLGPPHEGSLRRPTAP